MKTIIYFADSGLELCLKGHRAVFSRGPHCSRVSGGFATQDVRVECMKAELNFKSKMQHQRKFYIKMF